MSGWVGSFHGEGARRAGRGASDRVTTRRLLVSFGLGVGGSTIFRTRRLPRAWAARETVARVTAMFSGSSRRSSWDRTSGEKQVPPRSALRRHVSE